MTSSLHPHWDFAREMRSILLRFVAFAILLANLLLGGNEGAEWMHAIVVVSYLAISIASVATARYLPGRSWLKTFFVVLDAVLVALLLYAHILAGPVTENHNLTTTGLVVAFILLVHVGLKLERRLVLIFSSIVLVAWVAMLATTAARHQAAGTLSLLGSFFNQDLGLTVSFGFTAFAIYLLARDHDRTRKEALKADQRRQNLSRFFSPLVVSALQEKGDALGLERRDAAIMFVDLRDFTLFSEIAPAPELAFVLAEYRQLVSQTIFEHGGTVDKFIGDGVMAVFGQPRPMDDDADRAMACALDLVDALNDWKNHNALNGQPALDAGIGLHYGKVVGGVLGQRLPQRIHGHRRCGQCRPAPGKPVQIAGRATGGIGRADGAPPGPRSARQLAGAERRLATRSQAACRCLVSAPPRRRHVRRVDVPLWERHHANRSQETGFPINRFRRPHGIVHASSLTGHRG